MVVLCPHRGGTATSAGWRPGTPPQASSEAPLPLPEASGQQLAKRRWYLGIQASTTTLVQHLCPPNQPATTTTTCNEHTPTLLTVCCFRHVLQSKKGPGHVMTDVYRCVCDKV